MKKYRIIITHNNYCGSLERVLFATNLQDAMNQARNNIIPNELLTNHTVQVVPYEPKTEQQKKERQPRIE